MAFSFQEYYLIKQSGAPVFSIHISSGNHFVLEGERFTNRGMIGFSSKNSESSVAHSKRVFNILNSFSTHSDKDIQKIY